MRVPLNLKHQERAVFPRLGTRPLYVTHQGLRPAFTSNKASQDHLAHHRQTLGPSKHPHRSCSYMGAHPCTLYPTGSPQGTPVPTHSKHSTVWLGDSRVRELSGEAGVQWRTRAKEETGHTPCRATSHQWAIPTVTASPGAVQKERGSPKKKEKAPSRQQFPDVPSPSAQRRS